MGCLCCKEKPKSNEIRGISRKSFYEREIKVSFDENGEDDLSKDNPATDDDVAKDTENFDKSETGSQNSKCSSTENAGNSEPQNDP